tara:strand:- start:86352 stop:86516 length:165 start_codon:yes stop_codon:yes gene_type:complete
VSVRSITKSPPNRVTSPPPCTGTKLMVGSSAGTVRRSMGFMRPSTTLSRKLMLP